MTVVQNSVFSFVFWGLGTILLLFLLLLLLLQLWPFIKYTVTGFKWDYTFYKWGFLSTCNWYFGPQLQDSPINGFPTSPSPIQAASPRPRRPQRLLRHSIYRWWRPNGASWGCNHDIQRGAPRSYNCCDVQSINVHELQLWKEVQKSNLRQYGQMKQQRWEEAEKRKSQKKEDQRREESRCRCAAVPKSTTPVTFQSIRGSRCHPCVLTTKPVLQVSYI